MAADRGQRVQLALVVAAHDQRLAKQLDAEVVAGIAHLIDAADRQPLPAEQVLDFALVDRGVGVEAGRQGRGLAERPQRGGGVTDEG